MSSVLDKVRKTALYLSVEDFFQRFDDAWSKATDRLFKLETLQEYQEEEASGLSEFSVGNMHGFVEKARLWRQEEKEAYEDIRSRGIVFMRLRIARFPLSAYTRFEYYIYHISEQMGEDIRFIDEASASNISLPDLFIFDSKVLLLYDYGPSASLLGGYVVTDPSLIGEIAEEIMSLFSRSRPFKEMMSPDPSLVRDLIRAEPGGSAEA